MPTRRPSGTERAVLSDREDYCLDMLFQLARVATQDGDEEMGEAIRRLWQRFRQRGIDRLAAQVAAAAARRNAS